MPDPSYPIGKFILTKGRPVEERRDTLIAEIERDSSRPARGGCRPHPRAN